MLQKLFLICYDRFATDSVSVLVLFYYKLRLKLQQLEDYGMAFVQCSHVESVLATVLFEEELVPQCGVGLLVQSSKYAYDFPLCGSMQDRVPVWT